MSILPSELWEKILFKASYMDIICFGATCKQYNVGQENLWKLLLEKDYPIASPDNLTQWNIIYDDTIFEKQPYYETYKVVHNNLTEQACYIFNEYATCNKLYVQKNLIIRDIIKILVKIIDDREITNWYIGESVNKILLIISGLNEKMYKDLYGRNVDDDLYNDIFNDILEFLTDFNIDYSN